MHAQILEDKQQPDKFHVAQNTTWYFYKHTSDSVPLSGNVTGVSGLTGFRASVIFPGIEESIFIVSWVPPNASSLVGITLEIGLSS